MFELKQLEHDVVLPLAEIEHTMSNHAVPSVELLS